MNGDFKNPAETPDVYDPGDEVQRNFRYQHAYGAILLISGAVNNNTYSAIWCEHHEDLLAEKKNGKFEAYQIKTRQPELGYWKLNDEELVKSIKRFVKHQIEFGDHISCFVFVSNTKPYTCNLGVKVDTLKTSPKRFIDAIHDSVDIESIVNPFDIVLEEYSNKCSCNKEILYSVLKKTYLKDGPPRDGFETEISHNHVTKLEACENMPKHSLNAIRDEIVQHIYKASSLHVEDPERYLLNLEQKNDPALLAKRVSVDVVDQSVVLFSSSVFRYQPVSVSIDLKNKLGSVDVLKEKLLRGNLADQYLTMTRRKISAENRLLELNAKLSRGFSELLTQLESIVQAECDEALLDVKPTDGSNKAFGQEMLKNVLKRLKEINQNNSALVYNESYETLVGIAALLTENCSVWWSEKFNIKDAA